MPNDILDFPGTPRELPEEGKYHEETIKAAYARQLEAWGLTENDAETLGFTLMNDLEAAFALGFKFVPSIKIPYPEVGNLQGPFFRARALFPSSAKYIQPKGSGIGVYVPTDQIVNWTEYLHDPECRLIITEGEVKAIAIAQRAKLEGLRCLAVGLGGVNSFGPGNLDKLTRQLRGLEALFHPVLLELVKAGNRRVYLIYDYDGGGDPLKLKQQVETAEGHLISNLHLAKCTIYPCRIGAFCPPDRLTEKYAIDDHLRRTSTSLGEVIQHAESQHDLIVQANVDDNNAKLFAYRRNHVVFHGDILNLQTFKMLSMSKQVIQDGHLKLAIRQPGTMRNPLGRVIEVPVPKAYSEWKHAIRVDEFTFDAARPDMVVDEKGRINTFKGWSNEPADDRMYELEKPTLREWLNVTQEIIGYDPYFEWLLNWMAWIAQRPFTRHAVAPILTGPQGSGKSFILESFACALGIGLDGNKFSAAAVVGPAEMTYNFNSYMLGKILVVHNEFSSERTDHSKLFKALITSPTVSINEKFMPIINIPNSTCHAFTTNDKFIVPMTSDARREAPAGTTAGNPARSKKINQLHDKWMRFGKPGAPGLRTLLRFFQEKDMHDYTYTTPAPETEAKRIGIEMSKFGYRQLCDDFIGALDDHVDGVCYLSKSQIKALADHFGEPNVKISALLRTMQDIGLARLSGSNMELNVVVGTGKKSPLTERRILLQTLNSVNAMGYGDATELSKAGDRLVETLLRGLSY